MAKTQDLGAFAGHDGAMRIRPAPSGSTYRSPSGRPPALADAPSKQSIENLRLLRADLVTLRDLYKKRHWQVWGQTFYQLHLTFRQLHLLFDKHWEEQASLVEAVTERVRLLGGVRRTMAAGVAKATTGPRPPGGRAEEPVQLSRLLQAHEVVLTEARTMARLAVVAGDLGTNDLLVNDVIQTNESQVWLVSEHVVNTRTARAGA